MARFFKTTFLIFYALLAFYLAGPHPIPPALTTELPQVEKAPYEWAQYFQNRERTLARLRPDNQARIVWADSTQKQKSKYSLVYLHGFSASQGEGFPLHRETAQRFGANLVLARLDQHGLDDPEAFKKISPASLLASAKEALHIGRQVGHKVILMCTSTGGTLGLYLASGNHPEIAALILYAPLVDFYSPALGLLDKAWGLQIARLVAGSAYFVRKNAPPKIRQYWNTQYRLEATVALKSLVAATMQRRTFAKVKVPVFMGYYYRDEEYQDKTVSVAAARRMFAQLGTAPNQKQQVAFPEAGHHVICSQYTSRDLPGVRQATFHFLEK
ncbi:MAG: alpha/beta hydrolase [Microscillaceae bacterium]|nr:alpha/beta hydrolase [Microscillaceae bacterium]